MAVPPAECVVSHDRPRPRMTWHGMPSVRRGRGDVEARRSCDGDEDVRQSRRLLRPPGNGMRKASSRVDRVLASQDPRSFSSRGSPDSRRVEGAMSASGRWRCEVRECRFHLFSWSPLSSDLYLHVDIMSGTTDTASALHTWLQRVSTIVYASLTNRCRVLV